MLILPLFSRETVSLFLHFTVNPKPLVGFLDVPRCSMTGKEQTVCRWHSHSWNPVTFAKLRSGDICKVEIRWHSQSWDQVFKLNVSFRGSESFSRVKFSLVRFQQIESRWGYSGTSDKIRLITFISWPLGVYISTPRFIVDRRIFVVGFGLYGSIHGPSE